MGFYTRVVFPRLCDRLLGRPAVARHRQDLLADAAGEVLEIGFGTGLNLPFYPPGVAASRPSIRTPGCTRWPAGGSSGRGSTVDQRVLGGERLPFADGTFDCVVSTFTLCSIAGVGQALGEAYRVLRPGGQVPVSGARA